MVDARTFQALSDPTRLRILSMLGDGSMNVSSMVERLDCTQPAVSRHLKVLKQAGLIVDVRHGKWIEYSRNPSAVAEAADYLKALNEEIEGAAKRQDVARGRGASAISRTRGVEPGPGRALGGKSRGRPAGAGVARRREEHSSATARPAARRREERPVGTAGPAGRHEERLSKTARTVSRRRDRRRAESGRAPAPKRGKGAAETGEPKYVIEPKEDFIDDLML